MESDTRALGAHGAAGVRLGPAPGRMFGELEASALRALVPIEDDHRLTVVALTAGLGLRW